MPEDGVRPPDGRAAALDPVELVDVSRRVARLVDGEFPGPSRPDRFATPDRVASELLPLVASVVGAGDDAGAAVGLRVARTLLRDGLPRRVLFRSLAELERTERGTPGGSVAGLVADRLLVTLVPEEFAPPDVEAAVP